MRNVSEERYLEVMRTLLEEGEPIVDRTGVGTLASFAQMIRFDLAEGFPMLTTKKLHWKSIVFELLWILSGDTNIRFMTENGVSIWNEWADENGDLGPVYGQQWRRYPSFVEDTRGPQFIRKLLARFGLVRGRMNEIDQIAQLMENLKKNPASRRHVVTAWNPGQVDKMKLPPCHHTFTFSMIGGRLNCLLDMRSTDWFLGCPFNVASYSLLTHMIAHQLDVPVGQFVLVSTDSHLYTNHREQAKEQLSRAPRAFPKLVIHRRPESIFDYRFEDFELVGYDAHPNIKAPVAV